MRITLKLLFVIFFFFFSLALHSCAKLIISITAEFQLRTSNKTNGEFTNLWQFFVCVLSCNILLLRCIANGLIGLCVVSAAEHQPSPVVPFSLQPLPLCAIILNYVQSIDGSVCALMLHAQIQNTMKFTNRQRYAQATIKTPSPYVSCLVTWSMRTWTIVNSTLCLPFIWSMIV